MSSENEATIDVDNLVARVRQQFLSLSDKDPAPTVAAVGDWKMLEKLNQEADENQGFAQHVPPMHQLKGMSRSAAQAAVRSTLRIAQVFGRGQTTFNGAVARIVHEHSRIVRSLQAAFEARLSDVEPLAARAMSRTIKAEQSLQALQAELTQMGREMAGVSRRLEALGARVETLLGGKSSE